MNPFHVVFRNYPAKLELERSAIQLLVTGLHSLLRYALLRFGFIEQAF